VAGSADRSTSLWTVDGDQIRRVISLTGQNEAVLSVALSRDCAWLGAGSEDGTTGLWHIADITGTGIPVEPAPIMIPLGTSTQWVRTVAFGGEEGLTLVAESTLGRYRQWDLGFGDMLAPSVEPAHTSYIRALAFSPVATSLVLASVAEDGTIRVWNAADPNGTPISIDLDGPGRAALKVTSVALSPDGSMVAAGTERNGYHLWRLIGGASAVLVPAGTVSCDDNREAMVAFSPDGSLLAVGGCDGAILLLDPNTGTALPTRIDPATESNITALTFNDDGSMLAAGTLDGTIALWTRDETGFTLLDQVDAHDGRVWTLAFQPDGDLLASGGPEREVKLWRVSAAGPTLERSLPGHANAVRALTFSPDGSLLFSGSRDQTVRIWNTVDFSAPPVAILDLAEWVRAIAISSDGSVLSAASDQGMIRLIVPHSDTLAQLACERIARGPLSQAEWDRFVGSTLAYQDTCAELAEDTGSQAVAPVSDWTAVLPPRGGTGMSRRKEPPT
jgi:WD40 repeat protein